MYQLTWSEFWFRHYLLKFLFGFLGLCFPKLKLWKGLAKPSHKMWTCSNAGPAHWEPYEQPTFKLGLVGIWGASDLSFRIIKNFWKNRISESELMTCPVMKSWKSISSLIQAAQGHHAENEQRRSKSTYMAPPEKCFLSYVILSAWAFTKRTGLI